MSGSNNNNDNSSTVVLVTGASGYIGSHCVKLLVKEGYKVRGTVRSLKNHQKVDPVKALDRNGLLQLVEADLMNESCWESVVQDCDYILHVASPFPIVADESTIQIAINGTLNVLKAANKVATVRKVVLTSSCAAVNEGHEPNLVFNETSWTNVEDKNVDPYAKSKTLAEKAAWDYVNDIKSGNKFAMTAVNPTLVFGPMLISEQGASISLMRRFLNGEMPLTPPLNMGCVDVRDVAIGHLEAMRRPETDGERILSSNVLTALIYSEVLINQSLFIPSDQWMVWLYSFIDAEAAASLPRLGNVVKFDNSKAERLLNLKFREPDFVGMGYTIIERGIVKKTRGYTGMPEKLRKDIEK